MTDYGDTDAEDGYDASDPLPERVRVIAAVAAGIVAEVDGYRRQVRLIALAAILARLAADVAGGP